MATFTPGQKPANGGGDEGVPAGDYLIILHGFTRKNSQKSGKPFLRGRFQVIHGRLKGKSFFDTISLDIDNAGSLGRLSLLSESVGQRDAFDLDSDAECRDAFCNKPFKARINREVSGQYTNNGIARYLIKETTDSDRAVIETWLLEKAEKDQFGGGGNRDGMDANGLPDEHGDPPPPDDSDNPYERRGGGRNGYGGRGNDDIPF